MGSISKQPLNSENSSQESDHQPEKFKEENSTGVTVGRFYECNFCKRGFTNAQALGGHMNIHRKDRMKVLKQNSTTPKSCLFSNKSGEECMNLPRYNFEHLSSDHHQQYYLAVPVEGQMSNYQFCVPTSNPNNYFSLGYHDLSHHDPSDSDHKTENLSVQIDHCSEHQEDDEGSRKTNGKENEVDLELRLG